MKLKVSYFKILNKFLLLILLILATTRASFLDDLFNLRKTTKVPSNTNVSEYSINSNNENQQHQKFKEDRRRE